MSEPTRHGILHGIKVLDLTRMLSGPYCTMMLADHGAEVIKIEDGKGGDSSRVIGPYRDDDPNREWAGYFVSLNRNKKSIILNLKDKEGQAQFCRLVKEVDIVIENFRPDVMERLGLSYEDLCQHNPKLIYAALRGFGDARSGKSPYHEWPAYDVVAQAMGGLMGITGQDADHPMKTGPGVGDIFAGMMMAFAIMAALRHRDQHGEGQFVDIGMYDAMLSLCERIIYLYDWEGTVAAPQGNAHPFLAPFGLFPARDGHVAIGIVENSLFEKLARAMGRDEFIADERFNSPMGRKTHADTLNGMIAEWTSQHSRQELAEILGGKVPFGPVNNAADIFHDPHNVQRDMIKELKHPEADKRSFHIVGNPIKFSKTPAVDWHSPPKMGEHNAYYLKADDE